MSFFITEKETEDLLRLETRRLRAPGYAPRSLTFFRITWESFDYIIEHTDLGAADIMLIAETDCAETGLPFTRSFADVLRVLRKEADAVVDERIAHIYERLDAVKGRARRQFNAATGAEGAA